MAETGWKLSAVHEWVAHDPFGRPKPADVSSSPVPVTDASGAVVLRAARNGYVSFRVLVQGAGEYRLSASMRGGLEVDLFKAWYHRMRVKEGEQPAWWPDALVWARRGRDFQLPDPDNQVPGQTTQEFWVDIFVPPDAKPGKAGGRVQLTAGAETVDLPVRVEVLPLSVLDQPCIMMDHNSYGCRWLFSKFPKSFAKCRTPERAWARAIELLHDYHRLHHEHRGMLHNLGYGHSGAFDPIYGPRTEGRGRDKNIVGWELFDQHYGPLLDGSAFAKTGAGSPPPRRPATPLWAVYTPINPDWPASYLWWGEKGYEVEFTRGVAQFDAHFREKGWTQSHVEFFFNHKKRYRWFEWDGDEVKDIVDMKYHDEMVRMWESVVKDSPVRWIYRMDVSWQMKNQFELMAGHRNYFECGGFVRWYPAEVRKVIERGDVVCWYGGTPTVDAASSSILRSSYETWGRGHDGNCAWLTTEPGPDPWFDCDGCGTASVYPGEPLGVDGPIPSIRLKIERNGIQDLDLVDAAAKSAGNLVAVRAEYERTIPIALWTRPPRVATTLPPEEWDGKNLSEEHEPTHDERQKLDATWWRTIRDRALSQEVK